LNRRSRSVAPVRPKQQKAATRPKKKPAHRPKQQKAPARPNQKPAHRPKQQKAAARHPKQKATGHPNTKAANRPKSAANPIAKGAICRRGPGDKDGAKCEPTGGPSFKPLTPLANLKVGEPVPIANQNRPALPPAAPAAPAAPASGSSFKPPAPFLNLKEKQLVPVDQEQKDHFRAQQNIVTEKLHEAKQDIIADSIVDSYPDKSSTKQ
jgi:hypothetical protein